MADKILGPFDQELAYRKWILYWVSDGDWLKEDPEQAAQSAWQERQDDVEGDAKVDLGQEEAERHCPLKASWFWEEQVRQNLASPEHVLQLESQGRQVLS